MKRRSLYALQVVTGSACQSLEPSICGATVRWVFGQLVFQRVQDKPGCTKQCTEQGNEGGYVRVGKDDEVLLEVAEEIEGMDHER
eukprot:9696294-Alexandrium_andersonii.AAC.1